MSKKTERSRAFPWGRAFLRVYKILYFLCLVAAVVSAWLKMQELYNADGKTTIVLTAIHVICLAPLLSVYRALDIGKKRFADLCIGQILSIMISDAISFMSASLVLKALPHIEISILTLLFQITLCVVWTLSATILWKKWVPAQKVAVLYADEKAYESIGELHLDSDSFNVVKTICVDSFEDNGKAITDSIDGVSGVFLCGIPAQLRNAIMTELIKKDITVYIRPKNSDIFLNTAQRQYMFHIPMLSYDPKKHSLLLRAVKRITDIILSLPIFILASPIMLITAIAIKCEDKGPVLYKQERLTRGGKIFKIMKFRSMRVDAEKDGIARLASEEDDRITKVGKIIRATRIDELPQL
ncbi:MAG: sugar transferase, partial [Clostridia bacterium]|nr:sugar transferase [Clostridia bacterium]